MSLVHRFRKADEFLRASSCRLAGLLILPVVVLNAPADAGTIFGATGLSGGYRWDAAPRIVGTNERSLDGGLRYSLQGGSFQTYRDMFSWNVVPSVSAFQTAVEQAFGAWKAVDPASGLGTNLNFVADLSTPVVGMSTFGDLNVDGAEIDLLALNAGDSGTRAATYFSAIGSTVQLTSGTTNYSGSGAIEGADISMNNNPGAVYSLDLFRRLLAHEIGHAIGFGDVDFQPNFIDDNYNGTNSATALATLTNSWAGLVNTLNPAASPLAVYTVPNANPGILTPGVDILMESNGLGLATGNPVTNLFPMSNDDYGIRQFLYPYVPEPTMGAAVLLFAFAYMRRPARRA